MIYYNILYQLILNNNRIQAKSASNPSDKINKVLGEVMRWKVPRGAGYELPEEVAESRLIAPAVMRTIQRING